MLGRWHERGLTLKHYPQALMHLKVTKAQGTFLLRASAVSTRISSLRRSKRSGQYSRASFFTGFMPYFSRPHSPMVAPMTRTCLRFLGSGALPLRTLLL